MLLLKSNYSVMYLKRIEDLRIDHDLTQKEVADGLKLNREVYRRYEAGERTVPIDCLIKIAYFYNVAIDYIVGITDDSTPHCDYPEILYDSVNTKVAEKPKR